MKKLLGSVATLIAAIALACVMHLVPRDREIVVTATGPEGAAVEGFATLDNVRQELSGVLPQTWTFTGSKLDFELHQTDGNSGEPISMTLSADGKELGTVEQQSIHGGCRFTGIGPFGGTETIIGGTWTVEP